MKASSQQLLLILGFSLFFPLAIFHRPLGLPEWSDGLFTVLGGICAVALVLVQRRAKKRGDPDSVPSAPSKKRRYTWLLVIIIGLTCLSSPLWLPYTGTTLPLPQLIAVAIFSCVFSVMIVLIASRRPPKT